MSNALDPLLSRLERVLDLRTEQHQHVASNLANANTPQFKAKHLDFSNVLTEVMDSHEGLTMKNTARGHLGGASRLDAPADTLVEEPAPWSIDGNSVNAEYEQSVMMENHLMFNAVSRVTTRKLDILRLAITEGRG